MVDLCLNCGHRAYCHAPQGHCVPENVACREGCPYCVMNLACACQHRSVSGDTVGASSSSEKKRIEVDLEDLCVIVETAVNRAGLYMGRPLFPCWQRLPREVHDRLQERQREQMDRTLTFAMNARLHKEGNPHDTHLCSECVWEKAISRG